MKAVLLRLVLLLIEDQLFVVAVLILVNFIVLLREVLSASCTIWLLDFLLTMPDQEVSLYCGHLIVIILLRHICCRHWTKNSFTLWFSKSTDEADWVKLILHINLVFGWRTKSILFSLFASRRESLFWIFEQRSWTALFKVGHILILVVSELFMVVTALGTATFSLILDNFWRIIILVVGVRLSWSLRTFERRRVLEYFIVVHWS